MAGQSFRLDDLEFRSDVLKYARQIMSHMKENIEIILAKLHRTRYQFVESHKVFQVPEPDVLEWIQEFERQGIYLPISLQAWLIEVGNINLMGTHPSWLKTGYVFEHMTPTNDVWYTDPLVVELKRDDIEYFYHEWKLRVEEEGPDEIGPFKIEIAPDDIIKANVSGGPPYEIIANARTVDSIVFNERHCTSFTNYLRIAACWGGFPGFEYIPDVPQNIIYELKKDILPV